jgi:molybdenum cofactor cytidylyltransferase
MTCAIVLAAGRSQRMGTQKLLLPFAQSTVIARVVDAFLGAPVDRVIVVVRPRHKRLHDALVGRSVTFVENPDVAGDMLSSVRCALKAMPQTVETIVISPGDQPSIEPGLIGKMLAAFRASARNILVPVHNGHRGHPLVFGGHYRDEILTSYEGIGLRGLLQTHAADVREWFSHDAAVLEDLDTPAAFRRAQRRARSKSRNSASSRYRGSPLPSHGAVRY